MRETEERERERVVATQETHKHGEEGVFLRFELTALTLTLRIWQSAMKTESSQNLDKIGRARTA